jgi:hypothetical protein
MSNTKPRRQVLEKARSSLFGPKTDDSTTGPVQSSSLLPEDPQHTLMEKENLDGINQLGDGISVIKEVIQLISFN